MAWDLLGELTVRNSWQIFPQPAINSEVFRITTTIENQADWDIWKFRSGCYLRFYYADNSKSQNYYIKVNDATTLREFIIPGELANAGYNVRFPGIIRASRYLPYTPEINFAAWRLKIEAFI